MLLKGDGHQVVEAVSVCVWCADQRSLLACILLHFIAVLLHMNTLYAYEPNIYTPFKSLFTPQIPTQ